MLEKIIHLDQELFVFLNGLGSETYDNLWLMITKQVNWTPLFLVVFYLIYKKLGSRNLLLIIVMLTLLIAICDQGTNLIKNHFHRLRPCNNPNIKDSIRIIKASDTFSFFSGHAANSMASTVFIVMILKRYYKYAGMLFLFPLIFAYSRIYLGLHFPIDIITGYIFGGILGFLCYKLFLYIQSRRQQLQNSTHG
jgi:undecaprenyl-diphosphatase